MLMIGLKKLMIGLSLCLKQQMNVNSWRDLIGFMELN